MALRRVCVFCGSSAGSRPEYRAAAEAFAREMAARRIGLVFGGGCVGLMGHVADAVLAAGGHAIGGSGQIRKRGRGPRPDSLVFRP